MKTIKVSELSGPALDWAVAKCENILDDELLEEEEGTWLDYLLDNELEYSTDWAQGGPIIEREEIAVIPDDGGWVANLRYAPDEEGPILDADGKGSTPLIAAMRCFVASKLGDELEIPEELK